MGVDVKSAARVDGRTARSARTKLAVIDALLALMEEGELRPTAPRIAERAGVSLRTVFQHFSDLDTLFMEAAKRHFALNLEVHKTVPRELPPADRIDAFAAQRCRMYEAVAPVRFAAEINDAFSSEGAQVLDLARRAYRSEIQWLFGEELDVLDDDARRASVDAVDAATSFAAWLHQRWHLGHANERVTASMSLALQRILLPS